jgi:hypothetical protein
MGKTIKQVYFLFLTLSLTLVLADCNFIGTSFSQNDMGSHVGCSDISNHVEHSHTHGFEEISLLNYSKIKAGKYLNGIYFIPTINITIKNHYISSIWQPPKLA